MGEVGGLRLEVEFEAEGAGARAGEVGEGDHEVLRVGVGGVEGDVECEGDAGRAAGFGGVSVGEGGETFAVGCAVRGCAVCHVAGTWGCEIVGEVGE